MSKITGGFTSPDAACMASCIMAKISENGKCVNDQCVCDPNAAESNTKAAGNKS